jgi:hypothetical protein
MACLKISDNLVNCRCERFSARFLKMTEIKGVQREYYELSKITIDSDMVPDFDIYPDV